MKILFFGDIVGRTGRAAIKKILPKLQKKLKPDLVIANGENLAHGSGVTPKTVAEIFEAGVDIITTGNHAFRKAEQAEEVFQKYSTRVIRPANFSGDHPGSGFTETTVKGFHVTVANFNATVFMEKQFSGKIDNPFKTLDQILQNLPKSSIIVVDFHSEVTSEKRAFGFYADGRVSAVIGTHTHVQTADAQVLPAGTAYISDVGMTGSANSVLGVKIGNAMNIFLEDDKGKLEVEESDEAEVGYVLIEIDAKTGKAKSIEAHLDRLVL